MKVYNLMSDADRKEFLQDESVLVPIPGSDKEVSYNIEKDRRGCKQHRDQSSRCFRCCIRVADVELTCSILFKR